MAAEENLREVASGSSLAQLDQAISAIKDTLIIVDQASLPLASAYLDLALFLCTTERLKREGGKD